MLSLRVAIVANVISYVNAVPLTEDQSWMDEPPYSSALWEMKEP